MLVTESAVSGWIHHQVATPIRNEVKAPVRWGDARDSSVRNENVEVPVSVEPAVWASLSHCVNDHAHLAALAPIIATPAEDITYTIVVLPHASVLELNVDWYLLQTLRARTY